MCRRSLDLSDLDSYYDSRYAGNYMADVAPLEAWRTRQALARAEELPTDPVIVDYGCGRGAWLPVLLDAFPGARITGIEISTTAVEAARQSHPRAEFIAFDGRRAPLDDESADLVFSYHVIEHVLDLEQSVRDMVRLTRPGGYICAILPCGNAGSLDRIATRLTRGGIEASSTGEPRFFYEDDGHLRRLTSRHLASIFERNGCTWVAGLYSRHLAAVSFACAWPGLVRRMFDPSQARTRPGGLLLRVLRLSLLPLALALKIHWTDRQKLTRGLRTGPGPRRRLSSAVALLILPVAQPVGRLLGTTLPRWEWERTAPVPRGAVAQFLVFRRN
jgi:SAM-dependent methyltransferase